MMPLTQLEKRFRTVIRGRWADWGGIVAMDIAKVRDVIGIWEAPSKYVYMLRKHPALLSLPPSQRGLVDTMDREDDDGDE